MTTIYPHHFDTLYDALIAFSYAVYCYTSTRWYKRRFGCYQKPSALKRKHQKMKRLLSQRQSSWVNHSNTPLPNLWLKIDIKAQWVKTASNAVGR